MSVMSRGLADRLYEIALVVLGMILALSPLALWVAWSETVFVVVLYQAALINTHGPIGVDRWT